VDNELHVLTFIRAEGDLRGRIKRIRVVLLQHQILGYRQAVALEVRIFGFCVGTTTSAVPVFVLLARSVTV
jgi:hypothetical protein